MTGADFDSFVQLLHTRSGLVLTPDKGYLVQSRLAPIARAEGLGDVPQLLAKLRTEQPRALQDACVDAMATHESLFFRDGAPFEELAAKVLPQLMRARATERSIRIWCAACSSGQEPYSLAMLLQEGAAAFAGFRFEIVATDMSEAILRKARSGLYSDFEVRRGLSPERLQRWFNPVGEAWQISPKLQEMVSFRAHNLLHHSATLGRFDVILCRNVLIYFDLQNKRRILRDVRGALAPDGCLLLGSAETVLGVCDEFQPGPGARGLFYPAPETRSARSA